MHRADASAGAPRAGSARALLSEAQSILARGCCDVCATGASSSARSFHLTTGSASREATTDKVMPTDASVLGSGPPCAASGVVLDVGLTATTPAG